MFKRLRGEDPRYLEIYWEPLGSQNSGRCKFKYQETGFWLYFCNTARIRLIDLISPLGLILYEDRCFLARSQWNNLDYIFICFQVPWCSEILTCCFLGLHPQYNSYRLSENNHLNIKQEVVQASTKPADSWIPFPRHILMCEFKVMQKSFISYFIDNLVP